MEVTSLPRSGSGLGPLPRRLLARLGDDRLVDQLRRGNAAAFEVVYDRHHRGILSFCRHMLSSQEDAEDAVQHTFVAAYYDLRSSDKDVRLKPWLYTIARNRCVSILRARRELAAELDEIPTAGFSEEVQRRDDLRRLLADMHELPHSQRAALVLSELGGLSHAEIGEIVDCETAKVKSLVFQARSALIDARDARDIPCEEIREQLATLRGGALRRTSIRKHLKVCAGCRAFREEVRHQRAAVAALLPVMPTVGLKGGVLAAVGMGGGAAGGGAALLGGAAGGGGAAALGGGAAAKVLTIAALGTATVGGGAVISGSVGGDGAGASDTPGMPEAGGMPERGASGTFVGRDGTGSGVPAFAGGERDPKGASDGKADGKGAKEGKGPAAPGASGGGNDNAGGNGNGRDNGNKGGSGNGRGGVIRSPDDIGRPGGNAAQTEPVPAPAAPAPAETDDGEGSGTKRGNGFGHLHHDEDDKHGAGHDRDP